MILSFFKRVYFSLRLLRQNIENYQQTAEHFSEAATQAEARIR